MTKPSPPPAVMEQKRHAYELPALPAAKAPRVVFIPAGGRQNKLDDPRHPAFAHAQMPHLPGRLYCHGDGYQHPHSRSDLAQGFVGRSLHIVAGVAGSPASLIFVQTRLALKTIIPWKNSY